MAAIDMIGKRFGRLTVVERSGSDAQWRAYWLCECACGEAARVQGNKLRSGWTQSCGCLQAENTSRANLVELTGRRFGRLTVLERAGTTASRSATWRCGCDCGNEAVVHSSNLVTGNTESCGCLRAFVGVARRLLTVSYEGAHGRVYSDRGRPEVHKCIDCGGQAAQWSYNHQDPNEQSVRKFDARNGDWRDMAYSGDPNFYEPRCIGCHNHFDIREARSRESQAVTTN